MDVALSLGEIAQRLGAILHGPPDVQVDRVDTLGRSGPGAISFLANRRYRKDLGETGASAVLLADADLQACPTAALVMESPYVGYARVATWLNPPSPVTPGIHPNAIIDDSAEIGAQVSIAAFCVIGANCRIGAGVSIGPGGIVHDDVAIGAHSRLGARVTLCRGVRLGARCVAHPGVVIGADGFGIANDGESWIKVPQLGGVRIGDDCEIGANSTIDRGALEDTWIGDDVKIDNQVQIGHNVTIGDHTAIAGCVGIAGSAHIGSRCTIGGACNIGGHLTIADDVHLTGASTLPNSIHEAGVYSSTMPIQENRQWRRNVLRLRQLDDMARRLRTAEAAIRKIEP